MTSSMDGAIRFGRISEIIEEALGKHSVERADSLEAVEAADAWARAEARRIL